MIQLREHGLAWFSPDDPGEQGYGTPVPRISVAQDEYKWLEAWARGARVLEVGTGLGVSTRVMAETALEVVTLDIDPWVAEQVAPLLPPNVTFARGWDGISTGFDMAFVDGLHNMEAVTADLREVLPRMRPGGRVVFHDFGGSVKDAAQAMMPWARWEILPTTYQLGWALMPLTKGRT